MLLGKLELLSCFLCMWIHKHIFKIEKHITFYSVAEQNTYYLRWIWSWTANNPFVRDTFVYSLSITLMLVFIHCFTFIFLNGCTLLAVFTHLLHLFFYSALLIPRLNLRSQDIVGEHATASSIICHLTTTYQYFTCHSLCTCT